jgi:hypothetical protein
VELGKLNYIKDIRTIWQNEAKDFTPWLANNIKLLGDELGYDFEVITSEKDVGSFSLDILAKELGTGNYVAIENQLEITDHTHLGQLITYASGVDAKIAIWVSKEIREEHRKAVDWLNENTNDDIQFFAVEVQAVQIGDSLPAPFFKVKASPNEWIKSHNAKTVIGKSEVTEKQQYYHDFFTIILNKINIKLPNYTSAKKVSNEAWKSFPSGKSGYCYNISFRNGNKISVEVYIDTGDKLKNKELFDDLYGAKNDIESHLGELSWERLDSKKACRIAVYSDVTNNDEEMSEWSIGKLIEFNKVFKEYF